MTTGPIDSAGEHASDPAWLARFHAGDRRVLAAIYEDHFVTVARAVSWLPSGADRETVIHDVFYRLITSQGLREHFQGGSFVAWLRVVARNQAHDHERKIRRERAALAAVASDPGDPVDVAQGAEPPTAALAERLRAIVPARWLPVFETRFVQQLSQREAAARLGLRRTTLVYQEARVRGLVKQYVLRGGSR